MKLYKKQINNKGFTLVETMVAVVVLTIALTSLLGLTSKSLFTARYSRNEMTSSYLLQEAVDYIKNKRDTIAFQQKFEVGGGWNTFLDLFGSSNDDLCFSQEGCYFDINDTLDIRECNNSNPPFGESECPIFRYNNNEDDDTIRSFYNYDIGKKF